MGFFSLPSCMCPGGAEKSCQLQAAIDAFDQPTNDQFGATKSGKFVRPSLMKSAHEMVLLGGDSQQSRSADEVIPVGVFYVNDIEKHIANLYQDRPHTRYHAAEALAAIGPGAAGAVPALLKCLQEDSSVFVRKSAALALGEIGDASAQSGLLCAASFDENMYVRERAERALQVLCHGLP